MSNYTIENLFSLTISQKPTNTKITMTMHNDKINTNRIPETISILEKFLPNVLVTECYNQENLPFIIEVRKTEMGHLFEHILLEYLCELKLANGYDMAEFSGRTRWNWMKDRKGIFHIHVDCGKQDADLLPEALNKTIKLMKIILQYNQQSFFSPKRAYYSQGGLKNGKKSHKILSKST